MTEHQQDTASNVAGSSAVGIAVSFFLNEILPWTIHTIGALLSGLVVAAALFFFNRYLKRRYK